MGKSWWSELRWKKQPRQIKLSAITTTPLLKVAMSDTNDNVVLAIAALLTALYYYSPFKHDSRNEKRTASQKTHSPSTKGVMHSSYRLLCVARVENVASKVKLLPPPRPPHPFPPSPMGPTAICSSFGGGKTLVHSPCFWAFSKCNRGLTRTATLTADEWWVCNSALGWLIASSRETPIRWNDSLAPGDSSSPSRATSDPSIRLWINVSKGKFITGQKIRHFSDSILG